MIVIASHNIGKVQEIQNYFSEWPISFEPQSTWQIEEVEETGQSFLENALLKARFAAHATKLPALADDSGLLVPALHNAPGLYSARFAGPNACFEANIQKLLKALSGMKGEDRKAHFYCAVAFVREAEDPTPCIGLGEWSGTLLEAPQGKKGFGYDPIFYVATHHCSAAELDPTIKNQLSHRAQALQEWGARFRLMYPHFFPSP